MCNNYMACLHTPPWPCCSVFLVEMLGRDLVAVGATAGGEQAEPMYAYSCFSVLFLCNDHEHWTLNMHYSASLSVNCLQSEYLMLCVSCHACLLFCSRKIIRKRKLSAFYYWTLQNPSDHMVGLYKTRLWVSSILCLFVLSTKCWLIGAFYHSLIAIGMVRLT
jgi:hypothetical protein